MSDRLDPEIKAFRAIDRALAPLELAARERISEWLSARLASQRFWQDEVECQRAIEEQIAFCEDLNA